MDRRVSDVSINLTDVSVLVDQLRVRAQQVLARTAALPPQATPHLRQADADAIGATAVVALATPIVSLDRSMTVAPTPAAAVAPPSPCNAEVWGSVEYAVQLSKSFGILILTSAAAGAANGAIGGDTGGNVDNSAATVVDMVLKSKDGWDFETIVGVISLASSSMRSRRTEASDDKEKQRPGPNLSRSQHLTVSASGWLEPLKPTGACLHPTALEFRDGAGGTWSFAVASTTESEAAASVVTTGSVCGVAVTPAPQPESVQAPPRTPLPAPPSQPQRSTCPKEKKWRAKPSKSNRANRLVRAM
jgi:hypothetical protein